MKSCCTGGGANRAVGQRWVTVQGCWGVTLNLSQKSRNIGTGVYLPSIRYIKFWMATHWPETWCGQLCSAARPGKAFCWLQPCWAKSACSLEFTQTPCQACPESCLLWLPVFLHNISMAGPSAGAAHWPCWMESRMWREDGWHLNLTHGFSWGPQMQSPSNCLGDFSKKGVRGALQTHTRTHLHVPTLPSYIHVTSLL